MLLPALLLCAMAAPSLYDTPPAFDFYFRAPAKYFQQSRALDLDGDGHIERIDVNSRRAQTLRVSHGSALMWGGVQPRARPWCLRLGDVDGDGRQEIALGTFKGTRLWPRPHRTLSFYSWNGRAAKARWLGSRLSLPFREFHLLNADADAAAELVSVERDLKARWSLAIYNWDEFGFALAKRHGDWQVLEVRSVTARQLYALGDGRRIRIGAP